MQRRSVKEALRATFSGRRGLGYIPPALERLRGAFLCVSCPSRYQEHSLPQTIRSTCRIRCLCRWWTWSGPLPHLLTELTSQCKPLHKLPSAARGEGESHRLPCSGAHIGAQNLGAFSRTGAMQRKLTSQCNTAANSWIAHRLREVRSLSKSTAKAPKCMLCTLYFVFVNLYWCRKGNRN
jgi:hypothetical protein